MRTFLLILATMAGLGGAFYAYTKFVPAPAPKNGSDRPIPGSVPQPGGDEHNPFGGGAGAWVNLYTKVGELYGRFRSRTYEPRSDGAYHLVAPEAEMFQSDGQVIHLTAAEGDVRVGQAATKSGMSGGPVGAPSQGTIQDVTVQVYPTVAAYENAGGKPDLTLKIANAEFDNDTYRLFTVPVADPETGVVKVKADDVPVIVRGKDVDFDGAGLILYWNDLGHDLKSLQVAHGRRLLLKSTSAMTSRGPKGVGGQTAPHKRPANQPAAGAPAAAEPLTGARDAARPEVAAGGPSQRPFASSPPPSARTPAVVAGDLPSASPLTPTPATPLAPGATTEPAGPRLYLATFSDHVRVVQGGQDKVTADKMSVTFTQQNGSPTTRPSSVVAAPPGLSDGLRPQGPRPLADSMPGTTTRSPQAPYDVARSTDPAPGVLPDEALTTESSGVALTHAVPTTEPSSVSQVVTTPAVTTPGVTTPSGASPASASVASTGGRATTEPAEGPVEIFWTGPLTIVPDTSHEGALQAGQAIVRFTGLPVRMHQEDTDVTGNVVRYDTANGVAHLAGGPDAPFRLTKTKPGGGVAATVVAESVRYSQARQLAVFTGRGSASFPDPSAPDSALRADWGKGCDIRLAGERGGALEIRQADLRGDAAVTDGTPGQPPKARLTGEDITVDFGRVDGPERGASNVADTTRPERAKTSPPPSVSRVVVTGDAKCVIRDPSSAAKSIETSKLTVLTAKDRDGNLYPRFITADGAVHASDGQQDLKSQRLDVTLAPVPPERRMAAKADVAAQGPGIHDLSAHDLSARALNAHDATALDSTTREAFAFDANAGAPGQSAPSQSASGTGAPGTGATSHSGPSTRRAKDDEQGRFELESLLATGDVRAAGRDGASAAGDALHVEVIDGEPIVTLIGAPPAVVSSNGGTLRGGEIDVRPRSDYARVRGPGTIDAVQAARPGAAPRPMHVEWSGSTELSGGENRVDIRDNVSAETRDERGSTDSAKADHVILTLGLKPTTQPAGPAADDGAGRAKRRSTTRPGGALAESDMGLMKDKQVDKVTLVDNAEINSVLSAPDGSIVRRADVFGKRIEIFVPEKRLVVSAAGRMLLEDHAKKPRAIDGAAATGDDAPPGGRGSTAFQWQQQFTFDQLAQQAIMDGPVMIVHVPDGPKADATRLIADRVITDFEPAERAAAGAGAGAGVAGAPGASPTPAATRPLADEAPPLKLKELRAEGHVRILARGTTIEANDVRYDPVGELLVARGREGAPVVVEDGQDRGGATFREVWLNTRTNQIIKMVDFSGEARQ